ncbi:MDH-like protein [Mya arenaria]|uniref:MDH-like protein n=1 Tax=Mya arenaria TaxID=6604 RepID=A0ABY7F032_MYAAR|nr:MDH-like protein [Mya arenaria]
MADVAAIVHLPELRAFVIRCMASLGITETDGGALAELLNGTTATSGSPSVIKETVATYLVDGCNVLGSNHFGIAGWYGLRAMEQGMVGMSFTNTSLGMVPTRAKENVLGTNPICCAAPAKDGDGFVLDMA